MQYYRNILNAIGHTAMFELAHLDGDNLFAKAEYLNPGGSVKDRVALYIVERSEKAGILKPGDTIVEATSGNTGIGFAFVGVQKGYHVVIVMPEDMSEERKKLIKALGAELVLTPAEGGISGAVAKADEIAHADPRGFRPNQFTNPLNPEAHYRTTAPEIWEQMEGKVDAFVAGVGSGGTLGGVGKFLKERSPDALVVAVEPKNAAALLGHEPGLHQIQGIGDGFIPPVLDTTLIDKILTVSDEDAVETTRLLARREGALVGTSSGANVWASLELQKEIGEDKIIVTVLPDRAERYFSTALI